MDDLEGKVAVVTGGASGIGRAMVERFATEGMRVVIADTDPGALDDAADALRARNVQVRTAVVDVSSLGDMKNLAEDVFGEFGAIHLVCNNAEVTLDGFLQTFTDKDWKAVLGVNLSGVIHGVQVFLPQLLAQGEGHIVNRASVLGLYAAPFTGPYAVSKFGVVALSEVLFHELELSGTEVGVSLLCPPWVSADREDGETEEGLAPAAVADLVVEAVKAKRFYILSDGGAAEVVRARADAIINQSSPPTALP